MNEEKNAHWRFNSGNELEETMFMNNNQFWSSLGIYNIDSDNTGYLLSQVQFYNKADEKFLDKLANFQLIDKPKSFEDKIF